MTDEPTPITTQQSELPYASFDIGDNDSRNGLTYKITATAAKNGKATRMVGNALNIMEVR